MWSSLIWIWMFKTIYASKINMNIQAKSQADKYESNTWWQHKKAKAERKLAKDLRNFI